MFLNTQTGVFSSPLCSLKGNTGSEQAGTPGKQAESLFTNSELNRAREHEQGTACRSHAMTDVSTIPPFTFTVPGKPQPKERPRLGRGRVYTPPKTRAYERTVKSAAWAALAMARRLRTWPLDRVYRFDVVLFMPDARTRDDDNCVKSLRDGCEGVVFSKDRQVRGGNVEVRLDRERPRAEVTVSVLQSDPLPPKRARRAA